MCNARVCADSVVIVVCSLSCVQHNICCDSQYTTQHFQSHANESNTVALILTLTSCCYSLLLPLSDCHHHSARALVNMKLTGVADESMLSAWWLVTSRGKFISMGAWMCTYMPLVCGIIFILLISVWASK